MSFFEINSAPSDFEQWDQEMSHFFQAASAAGARVAVITSGGTTVPLERRTVRFLDNFSGGVRGALCAEHFLDSAPDVRVLFLSRRHSQQPFRRILCDPDLPIDAFDSPEIRAAIERERAHAPRLLTVPFITLQDYLFLLRAACAHAAPLGGRALLLLAAAVSDFYVPHAEMPEHKIQSADHGDGLVLRLRPVPKMLPDVRRWCPEARVVSFKLETDPQLLEGKVRRALGAGQDLVVGNLLQSYRHEVWVYERGREDAPVHCTGAERGDVELALVRLFLEKF